MNRPVGKGECCLSVDKPVCDWCACVLCHQHTDIALLTLKKPVTYKDHIRPVCMAKGARRYTNESATVAGWGTLSEGWCHYLSVS